MPPLKTSLDKVKKSRHRHSAVQLAALNDLYEQTEHPTLAQRTALAEALGLETKSVNAYFQNKRASSKKQPRGSPYDLPTKPLHHPSHPSPIDDDYYYPPQEPTTSQFRSQAPPLLDQHPRSRNQYDHRQFLSETDVMSDGGLSRLQIDELQRIYRLNPYPTTEESGMIAEQIGLRHQTIVEWFRTQRSLDRRGIADEYPTAPQSISPIFEPADRHPRMYPTLPPISTLPPASSHPSLFGVETLRRLSAVPEDQSYSSRTSQRSSSPRNDAPYGSSSTAMSLAARQRRGRPDPVQLNSLRRLLSKTPTPSIEERSALALEIGMDLGKVTNWFRNLRQSARKREKNSKHSRSGGSDDDFEPVYLSSTSRSRSETPGRMSSAERELEYVQGRPRLHSSDDEEEAQEAVTPSPSPSPPPSYRRQPDLAHHPRPPDLVHLDEKAMAMARYEGRVPYEDALLLLAFHRRAGMYA
ncbi:homeodomain transcription factor [Mycena crocata]|nr:homeodomain transcription factor [Mycena crocata]